MERDSMPCSGNISTKLGWTFWNFRHFFGGWYLDLSWFQMYVLCSSAFGEMIQFDEHIFQMVSWFSHQVVDTDTVRLSHFQPISSQTLGPWLEVCDGDRALTIFVALCILGSGSPLKGKGKVPWKNGRNGWVYVWSNPHPIIDIIVTTRSMTFLVRNPYQCLFVIVTGWGV